MSEGDFEPAKVISVRTVYGQEVAKIEVSSYNSLLDYSSRHADQLVSVRVSSSCLPPERNAIKQYCTSKHCLLYDYDPVEDDAADDRSGESDEEKAKAKKKKKENQKKA